MLRFSFTLHMTTLINKNISIRRISLVCSVSSVGFHEKANLTFFYDFEERRFAKCICKYERRQLLRLHTLKTTGHNLTTTIKHNNKQRNIEISICYIDISISISISSV